MTKTILITGCSTGIGLGAASAFAKRGYNVVATVRSDADAMRLQASGAGRIHPVKCDVTKSDDVAGLPDAVRSVSENGLLDGLINNAGIMIAPGPVEFQRLDDIRAQFEVNVLGMVATTISLLPLLGTARETPGHAGRIINMSSIEGKLASPFLSAYSASKGAIEAFSHSLRRELRLFGIEVVIVGPGGVKTEMWRKTPLEVGPLVGTAYESSFRRMSELTGKMEDDAATSDQVGEWLARIFETPRPRARYAYARKPLVDGTWPAMFPAIWYDEVLGVLLGLNKPRLARS